jgi:hypothetical protein
MELDLVVIDMPAGCGKTRALLTAIAYALGEWFSSRAPRNQVRRIRRHNAMTAESDCQLSLRDMAHSYCSRMIDQLFPVVGFSDMRPFSSIGGSTAFDDW